MFLRHVRQMLMEAEAASIFTSILLMQQRILEPGIPADVIIHLAKTTGDNVIATAHRYSLTVSLRLIIPGHSARIVSLNEVTRAFTQHSMSCGRKHTHEHTGSTCTREAS